MRTTRRYLDNWASTFVPRSSSEAARVTMMPVESDINNAGIWLTRPSPTDKRL